MRFKYFLKNFIPVAMLSISVLVSGPMQVFGGDDDDKKGRRGRGDQEKSDRKSRHKQDDSDRESRRQQRQSDNESRRQQKHSDRESRRQQRDGDDDSRRQQRRGDWNSRSQQDRSDREARRQQQRSDRQSRQQQVWSDRRVWRDRRGDDDNDRGERRRENRNDRRRYSNAGSNPVQLIFGDIFNGGGRRAVPFYDRGYGNSRREHKDERKAQRRYEQDARRNARHYYNSGNRNYYNNNSNYVDYGNNYYANDSGFGGGSDWKQQLLRVVIANVIGNRLGGDSYGGSLGSLYDNQTFHNANDRNYVNAPYYAYNETPSLPNIRTYQPEYGYGNDLFGGSSISNGLLGGGLLNSLPIADLIGQYTGGGGFASELIGNVLAQGYDQGYLAGQTARQNGYEEANYHDPYAYEGGVYDPYSSSVGENRRCLSEGYEIGYQDALNGQNDYNPQSDGNVDLVSLLLNNVLSGV